MMNFLLMTLSFTVAILLASFIACVCVMNKKVMKWYMKKVMGLTEEITDELTDEYFDKLED